MNVSEILVFAAVAAIAYLLPSLIAVGSRSPDTPSVFMINLWLGWTVIGWITAIQWALESRARQ